MAAMIATAAAAAISGYLIGSIPIADAVARRAAGIDLRAVGDRNPGFWNAKSALGPRAALPVFIGDAMKGSIAAAIGLALASDGRWWIGYVASFAAMAGHAWPVFARFRGGRSVSSFAGAVCVLAPAAAAVSIALLVIVLATTRSFACPKPVAAVSSARCA